MGRSQRLQRLPQLGLAQGFHHPPGRARSFPIEKPERGLPQGETSSLSRYKGEREWGAPKVYSVSPSLALPRAFTTARAAA